MVKKAFSMLALIVQTFEYRSWDVMLRFYSMLGGRQGGIFHAWIELPEEVLDVEVLFKRHLDKYTNEKCLDGHGPSAGSFGFPYDGEKTFAINPIHACHELINLFNVTPQLPTLQGKYPKPTQPLPKLKSSNPDNIPKSFLNPCKFNNIIPVVGRPVLNGGHNLSLDNSCSELLLSSPAKHPLTNMGLEYNMWHGDITGWTSIYCPLLVFIEKAFMSCLHEALPSTCCRFPASAEFTNKSRNTDGPIK
eukprot:g38097.t1